MITDALTRMPLRTPAAVLATSMAAAQARLPIGGRVVRMDGVHGEVQAVTSDGYTPVVTVVTDDGRTVRELAGYWHRSSL